MKVSLDREDKSLFVELKPGEKIKKSTTWGSDDNYTDPDSQLWYEIKNKLNESGLDFIKKRMWKDGHLVDDHQMYIRERKPVDGSQLCCYHDAWAIYNAVDRLNEDGEIIFPLVDLHK